MRDIEPTRIDESSLPKDEKIERLDPTRVGEDEFYEEVDQEQKRRVTKLKALGGVTKKALFIGAILASLIVIGTIYDVAFTASSMLQNAPILGSIYILLLFLLLALLSYTVFKQYLGYAKLSRIDRLQEEGLKLIKNPTKDVKAYALKVIAQYENHDSKEVRELALKAKSELDNLLDSEVIDRVDEILLKPLDLKAKSIIVNYSTQTAISTAISPVALIDAFLIISRSYVMIGDISKLYGYKPNFIGEIKLIKNVFINIAFASVTELLTHHGSDMLGSTILSKLSMHSAQGVANGVLTARVGLGTIKSVRPILYKDKNEGFLKNLTKNIINKIFSNSNKGG